MSETGKAESNLCYFARWAARFTQEKLPQQKHCLSYLRLAYVAFDTKELFVLSWLLFGGQCSTGANMLYLVRIGCILYRATPFEKAKLWRALKAATAFVVKTVPDFPTAALWFFWCWTISDTKMSSFLFVSALVAVVGSSIPLSGWTMSSLSANEFDYQSQSCLGSMHALFEELLRDKSLDILLSAFARIFCLLASAFSAALSIFSMFVSGNGQSQGRKWFFFVLKIWMVVGCHEVFEAGWLYFLADNLVHLRLLIPRGHEGI